MRYVAVVLLTFGNFDIRDYLRQRPFSQDTDLYTWLACLLSLLAEWQCAWNFFSAILPAIAEEPEWLGTLFGFFEFAADGNPSQKMGSLKDFSKRGTQPSRLQTSHENIPYYFP